MTEKSDRKDIKIETDGCGCLLITFGLAAIGAFIAFATVFFIK